MFSKYLYKHKNRRFINDWNNAISDQHQIQEQLPIIKPYHQEYVTPNLSQTAISQIPPQYFSGVQLKKLYNVPTVIPATPTTKKTTIAIIIAYHYPGVKKDLEIYWKNLINFGPDSIPPVINIYTMPGATQNSGWAKEECLDVQMVCTMNPNANIWIVEAKSVNLTDLLAALNYSRTTIKADIVSMSWGTNEAPSLTKYNSFFTDTSACYCVSSGDTNTVSWPATTPNCIAVGGTTLLWNPNITPDRTEYAWDSGGCGYSSIFKQPAYQSNISSIIHTNRAIPDVSLIADMNTCVYSVYNGNWYGIGGTSVSAPIFAGILSLANQMRFNLGKNGLTTVTGTNSTISTNIQTYLYKTIYPNPVSYKSMFYDVSGGSNKGSVTGSTILKTYDTSCGFDIPTGLGSPNATNLCNGLVTI